MLSFLIANLKVEGEKNHTVMDIKIISLAGKLFEIDTIGDRILPIRHRYPFY